MKHFTILYLIFLLLAAVFPAAADSVWTPVDDYFFETWQPESDAACESQKRPAFIAAGEEGFVVAVKTPLDQTPVATYPNGTEFLINFFCGIGEDQWGTVRAVRYPGQTTYREDWTGTSGYIAKKDLARAYDSESFSLLNAGSIKPYTEVFDPCEPRFTFVIWSYPDSGIQLSLVNDMVLDWFCHDREYYPEYQPYQVDRIYTAADGTRWLSVHQDKPDTWGWLNLDHPMDGAIETEN